VDGCGLNEWLCTNIVAGCAKVITPTQAQSRPVVGWEAEKGAYYTLVMTDPDAPSRLSPSLREWVRKFIRAHTRE
jgi:hypothetical protein